jgi:hypothetical protein
MIDTYAWLSASVHKYSATRCRCTKEYKLCHDLCTVCLSKYLHAAPTLDVFIYKVHIPFTSDNNYFPTMLRDGVKVSKELYSSDCWQRPCGHVPIGTHGDHTRISVPVVGFAFL